MFEYQVYCHIAKTVLHQDPRRPKTLTQMVVHDVEQFQKEYQAFRKEKRNEREFGAIWNDISDPLMAGLKAHPRTVGGRCGACAHFAICGGNTRVRAQQVTLLRDLCDTMVNGSLCAMGGMTPFPVLSALNHYPQDFGLSNPDRKAA